MSVDGSAIDALEAERDRLRLLAGDLACSLAVYVYPAWDKVHPGDAKRDAEEALASFREFVCAPLAERPKDSDG